MALKLVTQEPVSPPPPVIEAIPGKKDLNTYTTTGIYHQGTDANARSGTNYPPDVGAGLLEVFNPDGAMTYQRYTRYGNNNTVWTRGLYNKNWSPWKQVSQDGHKHTMSDIHDLPEVSYLAKGQTIARRLVDGQIRVGDPKDGDHAATKKYVDARIQLVSSLPSSPESDVLYVITE